MKKMKIGKFLFVGMFDFNFAKYKISLWIFEAAKVILMLKRIVKLVSFKLVSLYIFLLKKPVGNGVRVIVVGASKNVRKMC